MTDDDHSRVSGPPEERTLKLHVRIGPREKARYAMAARRRGMSLSSYLRLAVRELEAGDRRRREEAADQEAPT